MRRHEALISELVHLAFGVAVDGWLDGNELRDFLLEKAHESIPWEFDFDYRYDSNGFLREWRRAWDMYPTLNDFAKAYRKAASELAEYCFLVDEPEDEYESQRGVLLDVANDLLKAAVLSGSKCPIR